LYFFLFHKKKNEIKKNQNKKNQNKKNEIKKNQNKKNEIKKNQNKKNEIKKKKMISINQLIPISRESDLIGNS
jgi:hypothetical protein